MRKMRPQRRVGLSKAVVVEATKVEQFAGQTYISKEHFYTSHANAYIFQECQICQVIWRPCQKQKVQSLCLRLICQREGPAGCSAP